MSESEPPDAPPRPEGTQEPPQRPETPETAEPPEGAPPAAPPAYEPPPHPVRLVVFDDLERSRLTVFFRSILLIPHFAWQLVWGLLVVPSCVLVNWFAVLIRGDSPEDLHLLIARMLRYWTHVTSYTYLVSNPYPTFFGRPGSHPNDLKVDGPERQRRVITLFRLILAIPAVVLAYVFSLVLYFVALIGWFVALVIGRTPKGMRDLSAYCVQYVAQTYAYLMILTDRYPSFSGPHS